MDPYRDTVHKPTDNYDRNRLYRYILRQNYFCPLCECDTNNNHHWDSYCNKYITLGIFTDCHPLRRIVVHGIWWWRKYCPVDNIHRHVTCRDCRIEWIVMLNKNNDSLVEEIPYEEKDS